MNKLRNDYIVITLLILIALAVVFVPTALRAAAETPANDKAECVLWAEAPPWNITRCEGDWGEVCFMANSGMMACRFD